ncbi:MAG: class I SAM-dependent RNA methyltransferase [Chloroflexi bacterium]|nr:MAG: class I SAM-dependent RNA methyltransferase [Chloroflexota bacterium]
MVRCQAMVHGGACLAHLDGGETILVDGAIPGELVRARLTHRRGGTWFAAVDEVIEASPHRTAPPCPYVPECGGCQLQHIDYAHQLELKRGIVLDAMRRQSVPVPDHLPMHGMDDPWRYRWRGEFHVIAGTEGMAAAGLGFKRAHSWSTIAVDDCLIHHRAIAGSLPALRQAVRRGGAAGLTALHLTAGEDGSEVLVKPRPARQLDASAVDAAATTLPDGLRWNTDSTTLRWRGNTIRVRAETFIQVNQAQMEVLYGLALGRLGDLRGARVVDAYAGIGMLSLAIAETAAEVVCIEENRIAARLGMLNAEMNRAAARVRYLAVPVEEGLPVAAAQGRIDAVVIDPPRAGCAGSVVGWLALAGPPRVVYVSCDPATMARDLHILAASGPYAVEELDVVDMFPQTHHVEMVASLRRRE